MQKTLILTLAMFALCLVLQGCSAVYRVSTEDGGKRRTEVGLLRAPEYVQDKLEIYGVIPLYRSTRPYSDFHKKK